MPRRGTIVEGGTKVVLVYCVVWAVLVEPGNLDGVMVADGSKVGVVTGCAKSCSAMPWAAMG